MSGGFCCEETVMLSKITYKGFAAACLGFVRDDHVVYLHLLGPTATVRAIWAALSEKRRGRSYEVRIDDHSYPRLEKGVRYRTFTSRVEDLLDMVMVHPRAAGISVEPPVYLLSPAGHQGPPAGFFARLNRAVPIPFKAEWARELWERGLAGVEEERKYSYSDRTYTHHGDLVRKLSSQGDVQGYVLHRQPSWWLRVVQEILLPRGCDDGA